MAYKKEDTRVVSISLPKKILNELDDTIKDMGYSSRSEAIRDSLRDFFRDTKTLKEAEGTIEGVLTLIYHHNASNDVSNIRHRHMDIFKAFMHSDFQGGSCSCCEVMIFSGSAESVRKAYFNLRSIKGVEESNIFIAPRD